MKLPNVSHILTASLLAASVPLHADDKVPAPSAPGEEHSHHIIMHPGPPEMEAVTFLGVETMPVSRTLAAQLGLAEDTGLVVSRITESSPASASLQKHDILTKFDNQVLIDMHQLRVLVRSKKPGDEVTLTYFRAGKETTARVKLGKHDVPRLAEMEGPGMQGPPGFQFFNDDAPGPMMRELRGLPGMDRHEMQEVLRMIGDERDHWLGRPGIRVLKRPGDKGSTILNLSEGNFVFSDDTGSVEVSASKGQRELTVKNAKGDVTFKGPINNDEDRRKLPREVVDRLDKIEKDNVSFEPGEDFDQESAVQPPQKSKISQPGTALTPSADSRPF